MHQAQEAVARVKAPDGEIQPSTEIDLFISTEKIMVLNTDLQVSIWLLPRFKCPVIPVSPLYFRESPRPTSARYVSLAVVCSPACASVCSAILTP